MLIPHLHFCGDCARAISLYEKAFQTKADGIIRNRDFAPEECANDNRIAHAVMDIHGQTVFLNDRFGNEDKSTNCAVHLIIVFQNKDELLACYEIFKEGSITVDALQKLPYSELAVQFIDAFGVQWGFMVERL
ncbi:MAG: hypothetical protein FWE80_00075 [Oscillospiraceae bacterium]|nr:hypothetical protein [Oscillospiraceae bacterium]